MKGSPEKILTFLKLSDCLFTVEHGQKINSYNFSRMKYPNVPQAQDALGKMNVIVKGILKTET